MGDDSGTASGGHGPFPAGFPNGTFHSTLLYNELCKQRQWSIPQALAAGSVGILAAAFLLRLLIYLVIRMTGQFQYSKAWQAFETVLTILMLVVGAALGYFVFGKIVSAVLCGICFAFLSLGVALQALSANEKNRFR